MTFFDLYVDVSIERVITAINANRKTSSTKCMLAFSGGKDSICLFYICKKACERIGEPMESVFDVVYNNTTIDPPELYHFIREFKKEFPYIQIKQPEMNFYNLVLKKRYLPSRLLRFCCKELKEVTSSGRTFVFTGVRRAESVRRRERRGYEVNAKKVSDKVFLDDNTEERKILELCMQKQRFICNPIIDWTDNDVWDFIESEKLPYCNLYNEGFKRLGCIGCPLSSTNNRKKEFDRYPRMQKYFIKLCNELVQFEHYRRFGSGERLFYEWLVNSTFYIRDVDTQQMNFDFIEDN